MSIKKIHLFALVFVAISISSCQSQEEKAIDKLDTLVERVEKNGNDYSADDWKAVVKDLEAINKEMENYDYSKEELKEIGRKEGRIMVMMTQEAAKYLKNNYQSILEGVGSFAKGIKEGVESELDEEKMEQIGDDIEKGLNNIMNDLFE